MDAIRISYSDEPGPRTLYDYVDYSSVVDVQVDGTTLWVYWVESLLWSKHQLMAFDLQGRRVLRRRRVDPTDIAQSGSRTSSGRSRPQPLRSVDA